MARGITVPDTLATIYEPTDSYRSWRIVYTDRTTGKRKTTSGGSTRENAEQKARALSGEYVPGFGKGEQPTVQQAVDNWLAANRSNWSSRTYDQYFYFSRKLTALYGDRLVKHVSPADIGRIDLSEQSRGQQQKARSLVRGIFRHAAGHITPERADELAKGIVLTGTAHSRRNPRVDTNDIPRSPLVASFITTAYHTMQLGPLDDPAATTIDQLTGAKTRTLTARNGQGQKIGSATLAKTRRGDPSPLDACFLDGLPPEAVNEHRRGIPKHYSNPDARRRAEGVELAERYRMVGLATALGAGGGLRIGEVLGLRVRHVLSVEQIHDIYDRDWDRTRSGFRGVIDVSEQASQASRGAIWVTGTKGATKGRTVHLPAFLPNWADHSEGSTREQITALLPRFADPAISLWEATDAESVELWRHGFTPLAYLLWDRLWDDLWHHPAIEKLSLNRRIDEFRELLIFPTRNRVRPGREMQPVQTDPSWTNSIRIVAGTGSYQSQTNYAKIANPIFDHVAEEFRSYPRHRTNRDGRKGWTHHGLRHWAVSTRLRAGVPVPLIAKEMGHKNSSFTQDRYGHVVDEGVGPRGFEY
ncbi:tyrosine-type recombinase/integrase [Curtobacterium sp. PhB115]|uniref:tyrosine-type recombinase/integrase n=1 Tax=Curtobacterium sp. PhB115 TaxID=2485173 RepID=UPI000F4C4EFF|nr:tyrosine-type recombinase/integrase [Curtobacterium sp. PhB115]ROP74406.1 phage integrase family protein [Curtobacterium sp. PhB115]